MIIKEDYSYLSATDRAAVEQGVAVLAVHSLHFDRYFTEAQMAENRAAAERLTREEWSARCDEIARKVGEQNEKALSALEAAGLVLGQYHNTPFSAPYDLWFWCNCGKDGRQLDYVSLTVNAELPLEQQQEIVERAKTMFEKINTTGNCVRIQYKAIYNEQKLAEVTEQFAEENLGKFIRNGYEVGKIVKIDPELNCGYKYAFMRKNAKAHGCRLDASGLYKLSLENAA